MSRGETFQMNEFSQIVNSHFGPIKVDLAKLDQRFLNDMG